MKNSYLIQRLLVPVQINKTDKSPFSVLIKMNPFAFGGGLKNGGFSDKAYQLLNTVFQFDYMGSAEFEFGVVPETMQKIIANKQEYISNLVSVRYQYKSWLKGSEDFQSGIAPVYYICRQAEEEEVRKRIALLAVDNYSNTKERVMLDVSLANSTERVAGWLELDNGFFFFRDRNMYENIKILLGIK
jgi:hypothetical protein